MDNAATLSTLGTQDEDKQNKQNKQRAQHNTKKKNDEQHRLHQKLEVNQGVREW